MSDGDRTQDGVLGGSAVVSSLRAARDGSTVLAAASALGDRLAAGGDRSHVLGSLADAGDRLAGWSRTSWLLGPPAEPEVVVVDLRETYTVGPLLAVLDGIASWAGRHWRGSEPARAVVRARDAAADAPVRLLSWSLVGVLVVPVGLTAAAGRTPSGWLLVAVGVALLGTRERRSATRLRASAAGRVLAALLVPPDPGAGPGTEGRTDDGSPFGARTGAGTVDERTDETSTDGSPLDVRTGDRQTDDGKLDDE